MVPCLIAREQMGRLAPRAGLPASRQNNGLERLTGASALFDTKALSAALANRFRRLHSPESKRGGDFPLAPYGAIRTREAA